ncbi:1,4-dihydroxy-2-naphthoate octaprenyltransferase [Moraxella boevrei]|uniref:1,4-dihydroxy-2-naphthoate octaprenyltransferase n=1 Tax=Faucicola boevrei TaxID=346665 RepID=UPI003735008A
MNASFFAFVKATRPRTYPLAIAGVVVANALAFSQLGTFSHKQWLIFALTVWVALGLQILSNLANDYGDGIKGTDEHRTDRQTAQGNLSPSVLKKIIIVWAGFIFACGVGLLWLSFDNLTEFFTFLAFGILSIIGAMAYTMGKRPYGYSAKGEIAVFVFFGLLNVLGGLYLQTQHLRVSDVIASVVVGLLCVCVLMINNMRDIDDDVKTGKHTLAVMLGKDKVSQLYRFLLLTAFFLLLTFGGLRQNYYLLSVILLSYPISKHLSIICQYSDEKITPHQLAPQLKTIVGITLINSILISLSILLFNLN